MLFAFTLAVTLASSALLLLYTFWLGRSGDRNAPRLSIEEMRRHVVWRLFYINPADPRGWVPKPYGIGWTVNMREMRHVYAYSALIVIAMLGAIGVTVLAPGVGAG